jgi:hypothetical protein
MIATLTRDISRDPARHEDYAAFIRRKSQLGGDGGFAPVWVPDFLFDFQRALIEWACRKGRAAIFADCGLGKTPMQLVWAENVRRRTDKPVLVITPLAVSSQTVREGEKFGIECHQSRDGAVHPGITVTNYEQLHRFDPSAFAGAVADESSAIKAFDGKRRKEVTRFVSKMQYRLLATATPSPNDYVELGTSSECLGVMTQSDMLGFFFRPTENMRHTVLKEDDFWNRLKWHFKPHSEQPFWRWVTSWSRALRSPADLGFDASRFELPPLEYREHVLDVPFIPDGELFPRPAISLHEQRKERRRTVRERCERVRQLVTGHDRPAVIWCHYNDEGDCLEEIIPGAVQVAGRHSDDEKEVRLNAFTLGQARVLVTKPKIGAWGLNWQHCGDVTCFPSHSYEQFYQAVRRCWRYGRRGPVTVDIVSAKGESGVVGGLRRKQEKADRMFASLVAHMNNSIEMFSTDGHTRPISVPAWLGQSERSEQQ